MPRSPPGSPLFPYTTLFRSRLRSDWRVRASIATYEAGKEQAITHPRGWSCGTVAPTRPRVEPERSEEHTSELQSLRHLVCRLLLEKKKDRAGNRRLKRSHDG